MIQISQRGPKIDEADIAKVEATIGSELPASYRAFLLKENGGLPTPNTVDIDGLPGSPTDVQVFFGIGRGPKSSDLSWNIDLMRRRTPDRRLLPIACDSGGSLFCLDLFGTLDRRVMYCDLSGPYIALYEVAPDFESFLAVVRDWKQ